LLLAMMLTAATGWAQTTESVTYIDADGIEKTVTATVLTGSETGLASGWYVVKNSISYTNEIGWSTPIGTINIILADGAEMTVNVSGAVAIQLTSYFPLAIYGQSAGTGRLTVTCDHDAISASGGITINGGIVSATGTDSNSCGIYADDAAITINGGQVTATPGYNVSGIFTSGTITLGLNKVSDFITANGGYHGTVNIKSGQTLYDGATAYSGNNVSLPSGNVTLRPYSSDDFSVNAEETEYTIHTATGWNVFCDALLDKDTYNGFSGKTVYLANDIEVSRMAGSQYHDFCGTFDGGGHTLTFNYGTSYAPASEQYIAPFRYVSNTKANPNDATDSPVTIEKLHVAGDIYTSAKYAGGLICRKWGTVTIQNCRSSIVIHSSVAGDGTHGGFVTENNSGDLTITGCVFDGKLLTVNTGETTATTNCGGFVGWRAAGDITISNSLYAPADLGDGETEVVTGTGDYPSATFVRNGNANTITNCYYTEALGTPQGTKVYSITADENVTVDYAGTPTNTYATSGIATYATGIKCNDVLYASSGDNVSLTLDNNPPTGLDFINYTVSPEGTQFTGSGNPYTLTMPDADVEIGATFELLPGAIPYLDMNGQQRYCVEYTTLDGSENDYPLTAGWYVADGTINFAGKITVQGDVHLILKDGAVMNVGTESTPITSDGIKADGNSLSIYAQSTGANKGQLHVYVSSKKGFNASNNGSVTINGGQVSATGSNGIYASSSGSVTINGGEVTATGTSSSIFPYGGSVTINGGEVTATGRNGINAQGTVTINGGQVTATGTTYGIFIVNKNNITSSVTISGGQVTAIGDTNGINASSGSVTLGWTNATDFILASSYQAETNGSISIAEGKTFVTEDDAIYSSGTLSSTQFSDLAGKTLYPQGVVFKQVAGYGEGSGGWVFIASPVAGSIAPSEVHNLLGSYNETTGKYDYDLYRFNQSPVMNNENNYLEWENYHQHNTTDNPFMLVNGQGYLYATQTTKTLVFAGEYNTNATQDVALSYSNNNPDSNMHGWNLVGNPFPVAATVTGRSYYVMNETGTGINPEAVSAGGTIDACTGIVVKAEENETNPQVTFTRTTQQSPANQGTLQIAVAQNNNRSNTIQDNAIVSFNEGDQLGKFYFGTQNANIYIPQNGKEYAIACSNGQGEMPINFKATENGTYTISVNPENVEMAYLHLIDNMTGADVDLLTPPAYGHPLTEGDLPLCKGGRGDSNTQASYTFTARTTDYESRFKLVFIANDASTGSASDATFAFVSNGSWIIANEGQATLQVIDITGRILSSETINGSVSKSIHVVSGVYMIRLINGEDVKTQKIIIE